MWYDDGTLISSSHRAHVVTERIRAEKMLNHDRVTDSRAQRELMMSSGLSGFELGRLKRQTPQAEMV